MNHSRYSWIALAATPVTVGLVLAIGYAVKPEDGGIAWGGNLIGACIIAFMAHALVSCMFAYKASRNGLVVFLWATPAYIVLASATVFFISSALASRLAELISTVVTIFIYCLWWYMAIRQLNNRKYNKNGGQKVP